MAARRLPIFVLVLAAAALCLPRLAAADPLPRPRLFLILCPGLTTDDIASPALPRLNELAARGAIGLMNMAAPRRDPATTLLTLAVGDHVPAEPGDAEVMHPGDMSADEGVPAVVAFSRRSGLDVPQDAHLVHLGIGPLTRRGLNERLLGALLARQGRWLAVMRGRAAGAAPAGLLFVHANGLGPVAADLATAVADAGADVLVDCPSPQDANEVLGSVPADADIIVCPLPSPDWFVGRRRLPAIVCAGPSWERGLLTSATTRTPGLVSNLDLAPTLLARAGVEAAPGTPGHAWMSEETAAPLSEAARLDRIVATNEAALVPVFLGLGVICAIVVFGGLLAGARGWRTAGFRWAALVLLTMPLAMMLAVPLRAQSLAVLSAAIGGLMLALGAAAGLATRRRAPDGPTLVLGATAAVIFVDAVLRLGLVQFSMFSGYQLQGIRFYGIGNEYMGVLIGCALFAACSVPWHAWERIGMLACAWAVLGHPALGAKAGGIIVGAAALGAAVSVSRGRRYQWRNALLWTAGGFAAAFLVALLERGATGAGSSHMGGALASTEALGWWHLADIVARKLAMNLRIAANPIMLTSALLTVAALWIVNERLKEKGRDPWAEWQDRRHGFRAAGIVAVVAFLFNDSGVIAATFILGPFIMSFLHDLFALGAVSGEEAGRPAANREGA